MMSLAHQRILLLAIALLWTTCYGFPTGPPDNDDDVCRTRLPRHGVPPQTGPSPYVITTDATTYIPGSLIRVTIESTFRRNFRGFYIQARLASDTGLVLDDKLQMLSDRALGEFMSPPPGTKLHSCTQGINNAVSHSQNTDKSSVTVFWRAPSRPEPWIDQQRYPEPWIGPIRFVATVVESPREVFWTNTYSDIICEDVPPICTPPDDIQLTIRRGSGGTIASWTEPRATDNCGIVTLQSRTHAPGDFFNAGRTRVTYTYVDGSQNRVTCGFTIVIIEVDRDFPLPCAISPCLNGGQCVNAINGFECICLAGWIGVRCEILNRGECASVPCRNGACVDEINGYTCQCFAGWTGVNCETRQTPCVSQPCEFGVCYEAADGGYECVCQNGYTGRNCDVLFRSCDSQPCVNENERCYDNNGGGYACVCVNGYSGVDCSNAPSDPCAPNPCRNSGTCVESFGGIFCRCPPQFTGDRCQIAPPDILVDACANSPCLNGGTCMNSGDNTGRFMCRCTSMFEGLTCNRGVTTTNCDSNPCSNRGTRTCVTDSEVPAGFVCICQPGFFGATCDIGPCASSPCRNEGFCQDMVGQGFGSSATFACVCDVGFTGDLCEFDIIPPDITACPTGIARTIGTGVGSTTMTWTEPSTTDNSGFAYIQSQTHISGQSFFQYGSTAVTYTFSDNSQNIATCLFVVTIEERVPAPDPCDSYPCLNGGSCKVFLDNSFFCYCTNGFEGDLCETREMTFNLTETQIEDFENNYMDVMNVLPMDDNGVVLEGGLSNPEYYGLNVVPELTEAQREMILDEFPDIFIDEQVVIDEVEGRQGRRRRQSMSQRICPVRYENRTNLVTISGNDKSNANQNTQLVQVNNMIQWAFNAECRQTACHGVETFNGDPCSCEEEKHTVSALVYNIQAGAAGGFGSLSMTLKQIDVYTCDGKI